MLFRDLKLFNSLFDIRQFVEIFPQTNMCTCCFYFWIRGSGSVSINFAPEVRLNTVRRDLLGIQMYDKQDLKLLKCRLQSQWPLFIYLDDYSDINVFPCYWSKCVAVNLLIHPADVTVSVFTLHRLYRRIGHIFPPFSFWWLLAYVLLRVLFLGCFWLTVYLFRLILYLLRFYFLLSLTFIRFLIFSCCYFLSSIL